MNKLETLIQRLHLGFRGCLVRRNTTRHRYIHALYRIHHVDVETGSSYKLGYEQGREAIPTATPRFSRMPSQVERYPTPKNALMELWNQIQHWASLSVSKLLPVLMSPLSPNRKFINIGLAYNRGRETIPTVVERYIVLLSHNDRRNMHA